MVTTQPVKIRDNGKKGLWRPLEPRWEVEAEAWLLTHLLGSLTSLRLVASCQPVFSSLVILSSGSHSDHGVSQRCHLAPGLGYC